MDYKKLLVKYIQYIVEMEGTDYLGFYCGPPSFSFTKTEWDELRRLATSSIVKESDD